MTEYNEINKRKCDVYGTGELTSVQDLIIEWVSNLNDDRYFNILDHRRISQIADHARYVCRDSVQDFQKIYDFLNVPAECNIENANAMLNLSIDKFKENLLELISDKVSEIWDSTFNEKIPERIPEDPEEKASRLANELSEKNRNDQIEVAVLPRRRR